MTGLRPARAEDAPALSDLAFRSKRSNGYDDAFMAACRDELTVTPAQIAAGDCWVAGSGAICGFVVLTGDAGAEAGEIDALFVDPACQRQGMGRLLWRQAVARAAARGIAVLRLDADPGAVPFYRAMGCTVVGEAASGSIAGRMLPRMEFRIAGA